MERKDDIGEFINEKLDSAKKVAPANLWDRIDSTLEKRRKQRGMLLFWSVLTSLLVIALLVGGLTGYFSPNEAPIEDENRTIVSSEKAIDSNIEQIVDASSEMNSEIKNNSPEGDISNEDKTTTESDSKSTNSISALETNSEKTINSSISEVKSNQKNRSRTKTTNNSNTSNKSVAANTKISYSVDANSYRKPDAISQQSGKAVGQTTGEKLVHATRSQNQTSSNTPTYYYFDWDTNTQFATKDKAVIDSLRAIRKNNSQIEALINTEDVVEEATASKQEEANELEIATTIKDSTPSLPKTNFSITGHLAPLYFGPSQTESAIDRSLELNDKKGAWNLGFGLTANFRMDKNAMLSLGAYYSKVGYTTNNVSVGSQIQRDSILNFLSVQNDASINNNKINSFFAGTQFGQLKQEVSYIEVPLQFNYIIPKGKSEFSIMGGFSTYFLLDDSLTLINEANQELTLGNATNLSTVSLSLNAGVGFNYQLTLRMSLDVQPVFKYRIKTLNQASYNGETATIGILTGIRYKF